MPVQDDERERELARLFNLNWDATHARGGEDAELEIEVVHGARYRFSVEVKSTTGDTVSTARDVGLEHIGKWRRKLLVIGFYLPGGRRPELQKSLCLSPVDMEPWIASIERKVAPDFKIAEWASRRLTLQDLFDICGEQDDYSIDDAKRLLKQQWSAEQYKAARDLRVGRRQCISQQGMLDILRLRSKYISERGATLNNPHITKKHLKQFWGTDREIPVRGDCSAAIRRIASTFLRDHPGNPTAVVLSRL